MTETMSNLPRQSLALVRTVGGAIDIYREACASLSPVEAEATRIAMETQLAETFLRVLRKGGIVLQAAEPTGKSPVAS